MTVLVAASSDATAPSTQDDWILPLPARATVHEIDAPLWHDAGAPRIGFEPDLLIGERGDDLHYVFGRRAPQVAVDADGNIHVAEPTPNQGRVLVFDARGDYLRTDGQPGRGPGEYVQPYAIEVAGDRAYLFDPGQGRVIVWSTSGEHLDDISIGRRRAFQLLGGVADGSLVSTHRIIVPGEFDSGFLVAARTAPDMSEAFEYARLPWPARIIDPAFGEVPRTEPNAFYAGGTSPAVAVARDGSVYVSTLEAYQVLAYDPDGTLRWALRAPSRREPLAEVEVDFLMAHHNVRFPDKRRHDIDWPERQYALGDIRTDGHGRLYVFGYVPRGSELDERPVDVYSPEGERLFSGFMTGALAEASWQTPPAYGPMMTRVWQTAMGDHVYGVLRDAETDQWQIARHRLVWAEP